MTDETIVYEFTITPEVGHPLTQNQIISMVKSAVESEAATANWSGTSVSWDVNESTGVVSVTVYGTFNG